MNTFFIWKVILLLIIVISVLLKTKNIENFVIRSHSLMSNIYGYTWTEDIPELHYVGCIGLTENEYTTKLKPIDKELPFYSVNKKYTTIDAIIADVDNMVSDIDQVCIVFISREADRSLNTFICFPEIMINKEGEKVKIEKKVSLANTYGWINQLLYNPYYLSNYCYSKNTIKEDNRNELGTNKDVQFSYCDTSNRISTVDIGYANVRMGYRRYYMNCGCTGEMCRCNTECKEFKPGCKVNIEYDLCKADKELKEYIDAEDPEDKQETVPRQSRHFAVYMPKSSITDLNLLTNRSFMSMGQLITVDKHTHLTSENGMYTLKVTNNGVSITNNNTGIDKNIINVKLSNYGNLLIDNDRLVLSDRIDPKSKKGSENIKILWMKEINIPENDDIINTPYYILQLGDDGNFYVWDNNENSVKLNI